MEDNAPLRSTNFAMGAMVVVTFVVMVGMVGMVLYAPILANNKYIIPIRKDFYEKVLEKIYLPERLPYIVMVREVGEWAGKTEYGYTLIGRLVSMDYELDTMSLQDKSGRVCPNASNNWEVYANSCDFTNLTPDLYLALIIDLPYHAPGRALVI